MLLGGVTTEAVGRYIIVLTTLALLEDFTADSEDFFFCAKLSRVVAGSVHGSFYI